jgi:hypothetical protein
MVCLGGARTFRNDVLGGGPFLQYAGPCRWRLELRPLARKGASRQMARNTAQPCRCKLSGQPGRPMGPEIEGISFVAPNYGPVVQYCIKPCARGQGHRISSCQSCGSFGHRVGTTAPAHCGMPLYRWLTVGSPVGPPEAPKWHVSGTHAVLRGGTPAESGHHRRRRCVGGSEFGHGIACAPIGSVPLFHKPVPIRLL